jgi:hypothetical protein
MLMTNNKANARLNSNLLPKAKPNNKALNPNKPSFISWRLNPKT